MTVETISYSEISAWDVCQRQHYYSYTLGLVPTVLPEAINTGTNGHTLLQVFYSALKAGLSQEQAQAMMHTKAKQLVSASGFVDPTILTTIAIIDAYIKDYDSDAKVLFSETRIILPLSRLTDDPFFANVQVGFTPDVVFERKNGFCDVEDFKFVKRAWSDKKTKHFKQTKLYQIFLRTLGYDVSRGSIRFFNTTTGNVTVDNKNLTLAESLTLTKDFLETVREVVLRKRAIKEGTYDPEATRRTMFYINCDNCFFSDPCMLEAKGISPDLTFRLHYKKNEYSYGE